MTKEANKFTAGFGKFRRFCVTFLILFLVSTIVLLMKSCGVEEEVQEAKHRDLALESTVFESSFSIVNAPRKPKVQKEAHIGTGKWAGGDVQRLIERSYHVKCSSVYPKLVLSFRVWPSPKVFCIGQTQRAVSPSLKLNLYLEDNQDLKEPLSVLVNEAFNRIRENIFIHVLKEPNSTAGELVTTVNVKVYSNSTELQLGVDEAYTVQIDETGKHIWVTANTVFGVYHAFETLSHIIDIDFELGLYVIVDAPLLIEDSPRFAHRGIMMDTGRHYLSIPTIKRLVESMTYAKFNVLHWHFYDRESFPFRPSSRPELARARFSQFEEYTIGDIREIVRFSHARGVRVYIELDVPGHADSWCVSHPELCPSKECKSPLNIKNNETLSVIGDLIKELTSKEAGVLTDEFIHLGFDEVKVNCWLQSSEIKEWINAKETNTNMLLADFLMNITSSFNSRIPVVWGEMWDIMNDAGATIPNDTIFQVWLWGNIHSSGQPGKCVGCRTPDIVRAGHRVIWSRNDYWYLDQLHKDWVAMYSADPCQDVPDKEQCREFVIGGEACIWGERTDVSNIMDNIWPRAGAVAEKL